MNDPALSLTLMLRQVLQEQYGRSGVTFYAKPFASPVCRIALIADPDGNSICIHKRNVA